MNGKREHKMREREINNEMQPIQASKEAAKFGRNGILRIKSNCDLAFEMLFAFKYF